MTRLSSALFLVLILLFLILELVDVGPLAVAVQLLIPVTIAVCFLQARTSTRILTMLFLSFGLAVLIGSGAEPGLYLNSFGEMLFVIAFFTVLPVIAIPIRVIGYDRYIMTFILRHAGSLRSEYWFILAISYFYGVFLNLAAVPMSYRSLQSLLKYRNIRNKETFLFYSMSQGFTIPLLWTPFSGMLGVVMVSFNVDWVSLVPLLLAISLLTLVASFLAYWPFARSNALAESKESHKQVNQTESDYLIRLGELVTVVTVLLVIVFIVEYLFSLGLIISIIFTTLPFTLLWSGFKHRLRQFLVSLRDYFDHQLPKMSGIYMVFLSAGFFVGVIQNTGMDAILSGQVLNLLALVPEWAFYALFPWLIILTSYIGIHPIVTLVLLTGAVNWSHLGLDNELLALAYLAGGVSTFLISPFSGTVGLLKGYTERSYKDIIVANLGTVLVIYGVVMTVIQLTYWNIL